MIYAESTQVEQQLRKEQATLNAVVKEQSATIEALRGEIQQLKARNKRLIRTVRATDRRVSLNILSEMAMYGRQFGQAAGPGCRRSGSRPPPTHGDLVVSSVSSEASHESDGDSPENTRMATHRDEFSRCIQTTDPQVRAELVDELAATTLEPFQRALRGFDERLRDVVGHAVSHICGTVLLEAQHLVFTAASAVGNGSTVVPPVSVSEGSPQSQVGRAPSEQPSRSSQSHREGDDAAGKLTPWGSVTDPVRMRGSLEDPLAITSTSQEDVRNQTPRGRGNSMSNLSASNATLGNTISGASNAAASATNNVAHKMNRYHLRQKIALAVDKCMRHLELPSALDAVMVPYERGVLDVKNNGGPAWEQPTSATRADSPHTGAVTNSPLVPATHDHSSEALGQAPSLFAHLFETFSAKDEEYRRALLEKHQNVHLLRTLAHSYTTLRGTLQSQHAQWREDTRRVMEHAFRLGERRGIELGKKHGRPRADIGPGLEGSFWATADGDLLSALGADSDEDLWAKMKEGLLDAFSAEPADGWGRWRSRRQREAGEATGEAARLQGLEETLMARNRLSEAIALFASEGLQESTRALQQQVKQKYLLFKTHALELELDHQKELVARALKRNVVIERHMQASTIHGARDSWAVSKDANSGHSNGTNGMSPVAMSPQGSKGGGDNDDTHPLSPRRAHFLELLKLHSTVQDPISEGSSKVVGVPSSSIPLALTQTLSYDGKVEVQESAERALSESVDSSDNSSQDGYLMAASTTTAEHTYEELPSGPYPSLLQGGTIPEKYVDSTPVVQSRHVESWREVPTQIGTIPTPHLDPTHKAQRISKPAIEKTKRHKHRPRHAEHIPLDAIASAEVDRTTEGAIIPTTSEQILYAFGREELTKAAASIDQRLTGPSVVKAQVAELTSHVALIKELERSAVYGDSGAYRSYLSSIVTDSLFTSNIPSTGLPSSPARMAASSRAGSCNRTGQTSTHMPPNLSAACVASRRTTPVRAAASSRSASRGAGFTPLSTSFEASLVRKSLPGGRGASRTSTPRRPHQGEPASPVAGYPPAQFASHPPAASRDDALIENVWGYLRRVRH